MCVCATNMPLSYQRALLTFNIHTNVCLRVSGCELIPERRGRREGGARVGAGIAMLQCMHVCIHVCIHVCMYVGMYMYMYVCIISLSGVFQKFQYSLKYRFTTQLCSRATTISIQTNSKHLWLSCHEYWYICMRMSKQCTCTSLIAISAVKDTNIHDTGQP